MVAALVAGALGLGACSSSPDIEAQRDALIEASQVLAEGFGERYEAEILESTPGGETVPCADGERYADITYLHFYDLPRPTAEDATAADSVDVLHLVSVNYEGSIQDALMGELRTYAPEIVVHEEGDSEVAILHVVYVAEDGPNAGASLRLDFVSTEIGTATVRLDASTSCR